MPVYILHGFRWSREGLTGIRVRTILHDLEDVSADYIQNPDSQASLLESLRKEYPDIMKSLPRLTLLEQYDPEDVSSDAAVCQPYAFVADKVVTIGGGESSTTQRPLSGMVQDGTKMPAAHGARKNPGGDVRGKAMSPSPRNRDTPLSVSMDDVMASGPALSPAAWEALADLRDIIAKGEKIGWFVVVNGDPDRLVDNDNEDDSEDDDATVDGTATTTRTTPSDESKQLSTQSTNSSGQRDMPPPLGVPTREKGKSMPGITASNPVQKPLPPEPSKEKAANKSPSFKKFFGKREKS